MTRFTAESGLALSYRDSGPADGPVLVLAHGLGMDLRIWDPVVPLMPEGLRIVRYDMRGHGGSDTLAPPYKMGALVRDAEALLDHLAVRDCVFLGLAMGGMVAQGLAVKRMDMIRALILSNTTSKSGPPKAWHERADAALSGGMEAVVEPVLARWFSKAFLTSEAADPWRDMLLSQNPRGYAGGCAAIAGTDFYTPTSGLRLPCLGLAGSEDRAIPPDLVRETVDLIPGSQFELLRRAGHLPCVDQPEAFARAVSRFLHEIGHL
ncbi:3-oxoadipate enol-lactonase [Roseovarius sp. 2305UL8-3]|uniref:3-oxoadipate enol-lactonase n=1 Tax=Roseovarius conchicola TaxID=3121636 RepID=UPI00352906A6